MPDVKSSGQSAVLSQDETNDFPEEWYRHANMHHFWMRWRARAMLRQLRDLGIDTSLPLKAFEIGCAHGVVQTELAAATAWTVDGCDLNEASLRLNPNTGGRSYFYNIFDRRPEFQAAYDVVILYDVIEHIEEPRSFLEAAAWHLKPGGLMLTNVPALMSLYSLYDEAAGHFRRYNTASMRAQLEEANLEIADVRYWGMSLVPLLKLRQWLIKPSTEVPDIIRFGFKPPHPAVNFAIDLLGQMEVFALAKPIVGTSVMAAARKPKV